MATQSFHGTKNVHCGEGGALVVNDADLLARAEIIREKGTNRSQFFRGQVDKYRWVDIGSSYLPADPLAAFLTAQLERFDEIQAPRQTIWQRYDEELAGWAASHGVGVPTVPEDCVHPAHMYYLLMPSHEHQRGLIAHLRERNITAPFHYVPLHSAPAGRAVRPGRPGWLRRDRAGQRRTGPAAAVQPADRGRADPGDRRCPLLPPLAWAGTTRSRPANWSSGPSDVRVEALRGLGRPDLGVRLGRYAAAGGARRGRQVDGRRRRTALSRRAR